MTRRHFSRTLALGIGCLMFRFRAEAAGELYPRLIDEGEWAGMRWTLWSEWRPIKPSEMPYFPIDVHRCPDEPHTYLGNWRLAREDK